MIRPVDAPLGQVYGENPTSVLPAGHWILKKFGNYQPEGHAGEDYPCPVGTPIRAVTSGRVLHVGFYGGTYADNPYWIAPNFAGYCYVIDHGAFIGIYAHGKDKGARVKAGETVAEGQIIGLSGNTGGSTGPHLHFEALPDKFVVNSYMYGRINPAGLFGLAAQGTTTPASEEDDMFTDEDRALLRATLNKADGGQLRADLGYQNETLLSKVDGAYMNNVRDAQFAAIMESLGKTLNKDDGGYIVQLVQAIKPGSTDAKAVADALAGIIPEGIAKEVADELSARLGK